MSSSRQLLFVRIPKNASTSIYRHLKDDNIIYLQKDNFLNNLSKPLYRGIFDVSHATNQEIVQAIPNANEYLSFCVVRNPWDRMVSMYLFAERKRLWWNCGFPSMPRFDDFCQITAEFYNKGSLDFFPSLPQILWTNGPLKIKEVLFFENLQEDFASFLNKNNFNHISPTLPKLNCSNLNLDYRSFFTKKTRQIVQHVYNEDIKTFNYKF